MENMARHARNIPRENIDLGFKIPAKLCIHWFGKLENLKGQKKNANCNSKSYIGASQRKNITIEESLYIFQLHFVLFSIFYKSCRTKLVKLPNFQSMFRIWRLHCLLCQSNLNDLLKLHLMFCQVLEIVNRGIMWTICTFNLRVTTSDSAWV